MIKSKMYTAQRRVVGPAAIGRFKADEKGSPAVEFALIAPILILVLFGIVQFGFAFFTYNDMFNGAREGARRMAVGVPAAEAVILADSAMALERNYHFDPDDTGVHDVTMTIRLKLSEAMIVSILDLGDFDLTASATMRKEQ